MNKSKYSLKKVYESVFKLTKEDRHANIVKEFDTRSITNSKTLKDLYTKYNITSSDNDFINQTISTEIPGLGTFDLTPVQIGLIGCIDQYCYGDNTLAAKLIYILKSGVVNESSGKDSLVLKASKDFKLNYEYAMIFLDECKKSFILDENYNIIQGKTISQNEYQISEANGFLFELFLCHNIVDFFGEDRIDTNNIERLSSYKNVSYISTILSVIYNLINYNQAIDVYIDTNYRYLYDNAFNKEENIFQELIDKNINYNNLFFDFNKGGAPIDLYIRKNNINGEIISAIDLKTSLKGKVKNTISSSHESLNKQINSIVVENKQKNSEKDFNICLFNLICTYNKNNITISNKSCKYISFIEQYYNTYQRILKNQTREFSFTKDDNYLTLEDQSKYTITFDLAPISPELVQKSLDAARKNNVTERQVKEKTSKFLLKLKNKINSFLPDGGQKTLNSKNSKAITEFISMNLGTSPSAKLRNGSYDNRKINKIGIFFKENPEYIEALYQKLYEYAQKEFENDPTSVGFYYKTLDFFTKKAKSLVENLQEKEIIAKDEKQKKFLIQFLNSKDKRIRTFSNDEALTKLIEGINTVVSGAISNKNLGYNNGYIKNLIGSTENCGYIGKHFQQNPSVLIHAYQVIFEQFSNKPDLDENYAYYENIFNKVYDSISTVIEKFNSDKKQNEKIDLNSFNQEILHYTGEDHESHTPIIKQTNTELWVKNAINTVTNAIEKNRRINTINIFKNTGISGKYNTKLGKYFLSNSGELVDAYNELFDEIKKLDINYLKNNVLVFNKLLSFCYNAITTAIENFNSDKKQNEKIDLNSFNEKNLDDFIKNNESVLLNNKNLLREVYKFLF